MCLWLASIGGGSAAAGLSKPLRSRNAYTLLILCLPKARLNTNMGHSLSCVFYVWKLLIRSGKAGHQRSLCEGYRRGSKSCPGVLWCGLGSLISCKKLGVGEVRERCRGWSNKCRWAVQGRRERWVWEDTGCWAPGDSCGSSTSRAELQRKSRRCELLWEWIWTISFSFRIIPTTELKGDEAWLLCIYSVGWNSLGRRRQEIWGVVSSGCISELMKAEPWFSVKKRSPLSCEASVMGK